MPEPAHAPAAPVAAPSAVEQIAAVPETQVEAVLSLQRTAGNRATRRAIGRAPDERTEEINRWADEIATLCNEGSADSFNQAYGKLAALDIKLLLDVLARLRQQAALAP